MPPRAHRFLIPLAALLAVLPILVTGASCGHDFDFHLLSWFEAASQFAHLHYPHWAYTPAYNAGEPRFLFYPPLSWSLGAILGLVLPWTIVPAAFTFAALTLSGFTMHRLASRYASANAATLAAVLYLANPYMLFTAYERTASGELLAAAWLPLLFLAAFAPRVRASSLAIPIALLWLTNAPAAVMSCYALAFLTLVRLVQTPRNERLHLATSTVAATVLGLTLSAFYLVPAAYEQRYIQADMATISGMRIADNTLFHHMSPATQDNAAHDAVLHTASLVTLVLLLFIGLCAAALLARSKRGKPHPLIIPMTFLTLLIAFLLTPFSLPVWSYLPELRFLQFPWRLTALLGTTLGLLAALAVDRIPKLHTLRPLRASLLPVLLAITLTFPAWLLFHQPCDDEDTVPARLALFHSSLGTDPTDEYTPTTADNDALAHVNPPYWLAPEESPNSCDAPPPSNSSPGQAPTHLVLDTPAPERLILNRRNYPDWQVRVNGAATASCGRDDGLIAVFLPAGHDTIDLTERRTPDQTAGLALSALAALALVGIKRKRVTPEAPEASATLP